MLSDLELATVRAALRYWREEICPSGSGAAAPYFGQPTDAVLSESEVRELEQRLADLHIRYVAVETATEQVVSGTLIRDREAAQQLVASGVQICTVLLS
jgi:hypothetical protein